MRMSIVQCAIPGLLSGTALRWLATVYYADTNTLDLERIKEFGIQMGLSKVGHPTLEIMDLGDDNKLVDNVSDTLAEVRFHPAEM